MGVGEAAPAGGRSTRDEAGVRLAPPKGRTRFNGLGRFELLAAELVDVEEGEAVGLDLRRVLG